MPAGLANAAPPPPPPPKLTMRLLSSAAHPRSSNPLAHPLRRPAGMPEDVQHDRVQRLQAEGASIVEVLPEDEYEREHLAGALHLPLRELTPAAAERVLGGDRARPVVVYCQDVE